MIRRRLFNIAYKLSLLDVAALISSGLLLGSVSLAMYDQSVDNEFGPPGLHTIGAPQPLYIDRTRYVLPAFALFSGTWVFAAIRRRRRWLSRDTTCFQCRYSLTGNTSGTCPECGTPVPSKSEGIA